MVFYRLSVVADPGCLSRIPRSRIRIVSSQIEDPNFSIPDPNFFIPDPGSITPGIPDLHHIFTVFLTQKIIFKVSEMWAEMFIPDPDFFLLDPDPGVKKTTGSRKWIRTPAYCMVRHKNHLPYKINSFMFKFG